MRFAKDEGGATLVYVSLIVAVLVGITGLALDSGRAFTLKQELQKAADAAALAGAWQLDGTVAGSVQADLAARATPVVVNNQKFGATPGTPITIASTNFWSAVPADDDVALTAAAPPYDYIQVTTSIETQNTALARIFGAPATLNMTATAVARKGQALCSTTPLWMCLPDPDNFTIGNWLGKQVVSKAGPSGNATNWGPGNWGLLDAPNGQGVNSLVPYIASENGLPICVGAGNVNTAPGAKTPVFAAFNVRFDMFEGQASGFRNQVGYSPAENVVKGMVPQNGDCTKKYNDTALQTRMPQDANFSGNFGDGQWDCATYWATNHPNGPGAPNGCGAVGSTSISRYETYFEEISGGNIPNTLAQGGDNGNPTCVQSPNAPKPTPTLPSQKFTDRRILTVAGVDCTNNTINGNTPNVPVMLYLAMFMTEPVDGNQGDLLMEFAGSSEAGGSGPVPIQLRDWVELVR